MVYYLFNYYSQSVDMSYKLNWMVGNTYPGSLVAQKWLSANNISYSLTQKYTESGWLKKLDAGLYYRPDPNREYLPDWLNAFTVLSKQLHLPVHLAGLSSLSQQGLGHYLQLGKELIWVGVKDKQSLPSWFRSFHGYEWQYSSCSKLSELTDKDFTSVSVRGVEVKASCPELAAYEVVDAIGGHISFEHVAELLQGLINLSSRKVQSILNRSGSIQTNRIFLFLGRNYAHQWYKKIDESKINLGSGKRQVIKGGKLDERYQITVPESLVFKEGGNNG
jgi:hypothetical protein